MPLIVHGHLVGVGIVDPIPDGPGDTAGVYNFAASGAGTPGNGISGWQYGSGLGIFFASASGPPAYPGAAALKALGGWVRDIHIAPTGSPTADGLGEGTATTWEGFWSRVGSTFGPGDWPLLYDGVHVDNGSIKVGKNGNPTRPIRARAVNHLGARVISSAPTTSLACFAGSSYLGLHGIDFDAQSLNVWGLCLGERFQNDTAAAAPVDSIDVWHCEIHHADLATVHVSSVGTKRVHFHACDVHHAGQNLKTSSNVNNWGPFGELMYFGTGVGGVPVTDWTVDWCHVHDTPAGEAIDAKGASHRMRVLHNLIENVRVTSQGAITRWDGLAGEIGYNILRNIRQVQPGQQTAFGWTGSSEPYSAPPGWSAGYVGYPYMYEGAAIIAGGEIDIHHNVGFDLGDSMIIHYARDVGAGMRIRNNTMGLSPRQDEAASAPFYRAVPSGWTTTTTILPVAFEGNISVVASANATTVAESNLVNAEGVGETAAQAGSTGWGYQLAATSGISGALGAMGKAGTVVAPPDPPAPTPGEPSVAAAGAISSGGTIPAASGQTIVICALSAARPTTGTAPPSTASDPLGTASGWTEIGTGFDHVSGFRSDHRWFRVAATGPTTVSVANANRLLWWVLDETSGATYARGGNSEAYLSAAGDAAVASTTATGDGVHLVAIGFHSDGGGTGADIAAPSGYTVASDNAPAYSGSISAHASISGSVGALTAAATGAGNYSTTSVAVTA